MEKNIHILNKENPTHKKLTVDKQVIKISILGHILCYKVSVKLN